MIDKRFPMKCLLCSMEWGFDSVKDVANIENFVVKEICCPGCGGLSVPTGVIYAAYKEKD